MATRATADAVDVIAYAGALGDHLAHTIGCRQCGDTDYECDPGRALRLAAWNQGEEIGRDLVAVGEDLEAIAGRVAVSTLPVRTACIVEAWEVVGHGARGFMSMRP